MADCELFEINAEMVPLEFFIFNELLENMFVRSCLARIYRTDRASEIQSQGQ